MKYGFDDLYEGPRFQNRARRRKIKLIVSAIAAIIGIFIIIGIVNIFSGGNEEANGTPEKTNEAEQAIDSNDDTADDFETDEDSLFSDNQESMTDDSSISDSSYDNHSEHSAIDDGDTVSHSSSRNESQDIETNQDDREAVGTEQAGDHVTNFTKGSQDWNEMTTAVSSATGLSADNMIVWWIGNGGASNKAVSTVSSKDKQTYYRVQMEWANNAGWKPVSVEQIDGNDHQKAETTTTNNAINEADH